MKLTTIRELRQSPIAQTDVGELLAPEGNPEQEFLVKGTIDRTRAGLFFINIEGEQYTFQKKDNFKIGEEIICVLRAEVNSENVELDDNHAHFIIRGIEKLK